MWDKWWVVIPISLLLAGCSTVSSKRLSTLEIKVSTLEAKVDSIEQRQSAVENQSGESRESVGYVKGKIDNMPKGPSTVVVKGLEGNKGYVSGVYKKDLTKKEIQIALKNAGFYSGMIDGVIGKNTKNAIKEFQKANGLKADGKVGKKTRNILAQYLKE